MCYGCYEEAGKPLPNDEARALGERLREIDEFGGCHVVVGDWNLDDRNIDFCMAYETTTDAEREVMAALKALPEAQRYAAMAVADGYIDP